ncbi:ArsC family reductase [Falsiroseomonas sp. CW058]|uniref:ArsC family reductase n=1 Tax=Falsiroseomonas sp. CW058 TaxID=3388664 RepID=UPI003D310142
MPGATVGAAPVTIHGIRNCDTMRKARTWLEARGVAHRFHDHRADGVEEARLRGWVAEHGWQAVLNRAGTTFRRLPEAERAALDEARAVALMLAEPAMIRRPVLDLGGRTLVGFSPAAYEAAFPR